MMSTLQQNRNCYTGNILYTKDGLKERTPINTCTTSRESGYICFTIKLFQKMNCRRSNSLLRNILYLRSNHQCLKDHITTQTSLSRQFLQIRLDQFLNDILHRVKMLSILLNSILKIFCLGIITGFSHFSLITIDHIIMNLKCIRQNSVKNYN